MKNEIGKRIKQRRLEKGLTLKQLGEKVQYDFSNLSKIERGEYEASYELLNSIAEALDVPLSYLFGETVELPKELKDLGVDWIALAEDMKKESLTPEEIRRYVEIVKQLKGSL